MYPLGDLFRWMIAGLFAAVAALFILLLFLIASIWLPVPLVPVAGAMIGIGGLVFLFAFFGIK